jgi:SAM-dependent methyltransferase
MKSLIRKLLPHSLVERYWSYLKEKQIRSKSAEEVFTDIYEKNTWGGTKGEFHSGFGSINDEVVPPYIATITKLAASESFLGLRFVDLGCGDFFVGRQLLPLCASYTGVDVVKPLVARNQETFGNATTRFVHLNIAEDELPPGDVCFVRQVFQHMSNAAISAVLPKLKKYKLVFITEHYPEENEATKPNLDKAHGADVRVSKNSGIYLSRRPFNLPADKLSQVLEVPGNETVKGIAPGVIRTFLYKP